MFNSKEYWNNRLAQNYSLSGVGDITLDKYNIYLYFIRKVVFKSILKRELPTLKNKIIADIGSGTGFYIDLWEKTSVSEIFGLDISEIAVNNLNRKFIGSKFSFKQKDISEKINFTNKFDYISAFDVLFHIVDDEKYKTAIKNINISLKEKGIFIFSDNLIKGGKEYRLNHQVCRNEMFVKQTLTDNNFKILKIKPMFYLMNRSFYPRNFFSKYIFPYISKLATKNIFFVHLIGIVLTPIEIFLVKFMKKSYSTEILICQKNSK